MMRKLYLSLISGVMLVAFMGLSSSAQAVVFPGCEVYGNEFGVQEFDLVTDSDRAYDPSGSEGVGLACGAAPVFPFVGGDTLYENAIMTYPKGTRFTNTSQVARGSFVGTSLTGAIGFLGGFGSVIEEDPTTITAYPPGEANAEPYCDDNVNGEVVACFFANSPGIGHGWQSVRKTRIGGQTRYQLWIYPIVSLVGDYTVAKIDWDFCTYYGKPGTELCGSEGDLPTAYNGHASAPDCSNGSGVFEIYITNRGGDTSGTITHCEAWTKRNFAFKEAPAPVGGAGNGAIASKR